MENHKLLSSFVYKEGADYRFHITQNLVIRIYGYDFGRATYIDQKEKIRLITNGATLIISANYAWDGCFPKFSLGNYWIGTPDYPETVLASLIHDTLCQFSEVGCLKVNRKEIDKIFYKIMQQNNFKFAFLYYQAVNIFGGIYHMWGAEDRNKLKCFEN